MTQKDKDLLLKDLCGRLTYGVKVKFGDSKPALLTVIERDEFGWQIGSEDEFDGMITIIDNIKPYLFPLSSMTKEQVDQVSDEIDHLLLESLRNRETGFTIIDCKQHVYPIDWFNKNHFDYRGLIEMGLAIDATDKNIY